MIGRTLGHYRIQSELGAGGMGTVYLAHDTRLERLVAIKVLAGTGDAAAQDRLLREARAAAALNHPHICSVYEVAEADGIAFIVMEYVDGQRLDRLIPTHGIRHDAGLRYGVQVAGALAHAHARGIVHRDLKPANIIVSAADEAKVLDFGIARRLPAPESETATWADREDEGSVSGTMAYMAPEVLRGEPAGPGSDVWAFGVLLYELTTGRLPFPGRSSFDIAAAVLEKAADPMPASVPSALREVIQRCLAKAPADRYQDATEMRQALETVHVPSRRPRLPRWTAAAALALVAVAFVTGRSLVERGAEPADAGAPPVPVIAVAPFQNLSGDPGKDYLGAGVAGALMTHLSAIDSIHVVSADLDEGGHRPDHVRRILAESGANYAVVGGVQQFGERLRVTLRLMGANQIVAWAGAYDGTLDEFFELQDRTATGISEALQLRLSPAEQRRLAQPLTNSGAALTDYFQATALLQQYDIPTNLDRAVNLLEAAVDRDPAFAAARALLGRAYWLRFHTTKDPDWSRRAIATALQALEADPEQPEVRITLARVYGGTGQRDRAVEELRRALDLQPNNDEIYRALGSLLRADEAQKAIERAVALRPGYWQNHNALGTFHFHAGRYVEAANAFRRVIELRPDSTAGFVNLGAAAYHAGDSDAALASWRRAAELTPDAKVLSNIGTAQYEQGLFEQAARAFEQAIELSPGDPVYHRNLGDVHRRLGRSDLARSAYTRMVELLEGLLRVNPTKADVLSALAIGRAKLGDHDEAVRAAERAAALAPKDVEVLYERAVVYALAGSTDRALMHLREAVDAGYSRSSAAKNDDLIALRDLPEFQQLVRNAVDGIAR